MITPPPPHTKESVGNEEKKESVGTVDPTSLPTYIIIREKRRGGARLNAGRKADQVELPDGFQVKVRVRKTGMLKGKKDRYFVAPSGSILRSRQELEYYLQILKDCGMIPEKDGTSLPS